jgi:phage anti-repressor protein
MELIKIETSEDGKQTVNARSLHEFLESKQHFGNWITKKIADYDFIENEDFTTINKKINRQTLKDYYISLDMAKELSMVERNTQGKEVRKYFIQCEKDLKDKVDNMSPAEFLVQQAQILLAQERRVKAVEDKVLEIEAKQKTSDASFYTVAGYCTLQKLKIPISKANVLGRQCSKMSKELDYEIGKASDSRFGSVNTYHLDVLSSVIE